MTGGIVLVDDSTDEGDAMSAGGHGQVDIVGGDATQGEDGTV